MSTTTEIERQKRVAARNHRALESAMQKLISPVTRGCRAVGTDAELAREEQAYKRNPELGSQAADYMRRRSSVRLFFGLLGVMIVGESVFVMPRLMDSVSAVSGGLFDSPATRFAGACVYLLAMVAPIVALKRFLPPLIPNLRDAISVEVNDPECPQAVGAAFHRRKHARIKSLVHLVAATTYLSVVAWVMGHNLAAGRLFLERVQALEDAQAQNSSQLSLGDSLFDAPPVGIGAGNASENRSVEAPRTSKNPQTAVVAIFLLVHAAALLVPCNGKEIGEIRQSMAAEGVTLTPAEIRRRRAHCASIIARCAGRVQKAIIVLGRDEGSRSLLQSRVRDLVADLESTFQKSGSEMSAVQLRALNGHPMAAVSLDSAESLG